MKKSDLTILKEDGKQEQLFCPFCESPIGKFSGSDYYCKDMCEESRKLDKTVA